MCGDSLHPLGHVFRYGHRQEPPPLTSPLATQARIVAELRERLKAEHGLEDGDEALEDTLEGATELPEMLGHLARSIRWNEHQAKAMAEIIRENQSRKAAYESRAERARNTLSWAMQESGMKKIPADVAPDLTVSVREGNPELIIPEDDKVPTAYCRVKYSPNREVIREVLERGDRLDWAYLGNSKPVLTIRSK